MPGIKLVPLSPPKVTRSTGNRQDTSRKIKVKRYLYALLQSLLSTLAATANAVTISSVSINYTTNKITIVGSALCTAAHGPVVTFNSHSLLINSCSGSSIVASLPAQAPGSYVLTVSDNNVSAAPFYVTYGAVGPQGPVGPAGTPGIPGAKGGTGLTGATGATGAAGQAGPAGPIGPVGLTGSTGATGLTGATGATGAAGAIGPVGPAGSKGTKGSNGAAGGHC